MNEIKLLDKQTIDKIAAGEVVERPASIVKELIENSIDAGATSISVEIKDGGISLIRITDNGSGMPADQVQIAFERHSTSKIRSAADLSFIQSLGFRGEALSSISAVSKTELCTKTKEALTGIIYCIEGGQEVSCTEAGLPEGSTLIVRDLFYNTPARRKFLKSAQTEAGYVMDVVQRTALSHPEISFKYTVNGAVRLSTPGSGSLKDAIYSIFGRDISRNLLEIHESGDILSIDGFIGKPEIARGNRNFEFYYVNGRFIRDKIVQKALEDAYTGYQMKGTFPFCVFQIRMEPELVDVNVHPAKMEVRFFNGEAVYQAIHEMIRDRIVKRESIPEVRFGSANKGQQHSGAGSDQKAYIPEPFETKASEHFYRSDSRVSWLDEERKYGGKSKGVHQGVQTLEHLYEFIHPADADRYYADPDVHESVRLDAAQDNPTDDHVVAAQGNPSEDPASAIQRDSANNRTAAQNDPEIDPASAIQRDFTNNRTAAQNDPAIDPAGDKQTNDSEIRYEQQTIPTENFLSAQSRKEHRIIGSAFDTYWIVQMKEKLFIIDQHAAHEKVLYERFIRKLRSGDHFSQQLMPSVILTLSSREESLFLKYREQFEQIGFELEHFGGMEYALKAVPTDFYSVDYKVLFLEMLEDLSDVPAGKEPEILKDRVATAACKAAVKGGNVLSLSEADRLIDELLTLENPYNCPHGRPTIISMTKYELEKKFKRIL